MLQLKTLDAAACKGNLIIFPIPSLLLQSFISPLCHYTTLLSSTVLPRPTGPLPPTSRSPRKKFLAGSCIMLGSDVPAADWEARRGMPATFHLFSFPPLAGGTIPALIKWMRWTGVETDPEVQGDWAGPSMARLAPQIPDLLVLLHLYCNCSMHLYFIVQYVFTTEMLLW